MPNSKLDNDTLRYYSLARLKLLGQAILADENAAGAAGNAAANSVFGEI